MKNVVCPYCERVHMAIKDNIESAQGSILCPFKNEGFGWRIHKGKVEVHS